MRVIRFNVDGELDVTRLMNLNVSEYDVGLL